MTNNGTFVYGSKPDEFRVFLCPCFSDIKPLFDKLIVYLNNYAKALGIEDNSLLTYNKDTMLEILTRIEKRRIYFHIFHNALKMGERKEGALFCFWILKLKPFRYAGKSNEELNSKLALCVFTNMVYASAARRKHTVIFTKEYLANLYYSFRYQDLSKEAIMLLADSLLFPVERSKIQRPKSD